MAARRLVMVLLALLIVSTFAATLVPPPDEGDEETSTSTPLTTAADDPDPKLVRQAVRVEAKKPPDVRLRLGDELELTVESKRFREVEIPAFGEYDELDQYAPAVFDLLPDDAGKYPVRLVPSGDVVARIVVSECCRTSKRSGDTSRSR